MIFVKGGFYRFDLIVQLSAKPLKLRIPNNVSALWRILWRCDERLQKIKQNVCNHRIRNARLFQKVNRGAKRILGQFSLLVTHDLRKSSIAICGGQIFSHRTIISALDHPVQIPEQRRV